MSHRHAIRVWRTGGVIALALLLAPAAARAQFTEPPAPVAYAIRNATLIQADGTRLANQTIVIRARRIEAIGTDAAVPADARVLEGDTLFVYPGFVDAVGPVEFEFPRDTTDRSQIRSWDPPRTLRGFMPSRRVLDYMTATGDDGADQRKDGVVAVAAHPGLDQSLMSGRGVLVLLRADAGAPQDLVIQPVLPPLMSLRGGRGVYPSTQMGVLAWYRQTFLDAQRNNVIASNGVGSGPSLAFDADMDVLQDLLREQGRVYFVANDANEIRKILSLADEFGFSPVIVGGSEAWQVAEQLAERRVPVLVSVDFEEPERWKPDDEPAEGEQPEPLDPGAEREKRELEAAYTNASRLAAAGVTFALVSGGAGDLREGVLKTIEYGLSDADALRAVTATPATLLGVPQLARIEQGGAATFIVTDAPVFTEDAKVLYTFVEGVLEKGATARSESADSTDGDAVNAAGAWTVELIGAGMPPFTMTLEQDGNDLTGTLESPEGTVSVTGTMDGDRITLGGTMSAGGQSIRIDMTGVVDGDTASGSVETPMGAVDWEARRTGPGAQR